METPDDDGTADGLAERGAATESERRLARAIRAQQFPGLALGPTQTDVDLGAAAIDANVQRLGRFTVLRKLGEGGMGVVFACYDEQLERKVAVKLLRSRYQSGVARMRLEREAQALARLSHPNVVQIYELGEHQGALFVVMELVVGETLSAWLWPDGREAGTDRDWRAIVAVLREAGAGLAAAHAAGLVHRDFKPENVVVGVDGRVRTLDFGLVRTLEPELLDSELELAGSELDSNTALTRAGAWMGTPAYMAPEQFDGLVCDAKSDQFSFSAVAFEALFGCRPFAGATVEALAASVRRGVAAPIREDSPVPKRLRAAILRGLAADPASRWPAMAALLTELDLSLDARRRSRRVAWAFGTAVLVVAAVGLARSSVSGPRLCELDETLLAGTWDDERRATLRGALASQADGETSLRVIDEALTSWTADWLESQRRACEATRVLGTQSDAMLDRRTSCLERQRRELDALVELLLCPDGAARAFELLERLPDLATCDDPRLAETSHPLPADEAQREHIFASYEQISRARALARTSRIDEAEALVEQLASAADLGHLPLTIEIQALLAERSLWRGRLAEAVPSLRAATRAAEVAQLEELAATLRTQLATHVVGHWGRRELQALVLEEAETAVARLARPHDARAAELALARAAWLDDSGDVEGALAIFSATITAARERGEVGLLARA
ncbi:MAG TPA: serine/threonine-protein kinase, partial [Enhygromyxa sp.]|nr:serine/threonine-protein kinase [Enhygromyxa sp.]